MLTQDHLLIFKQKHKNKKEMRLKIPYKLIRGITISLHANSAEWVLHLDMQADLRIAMQNNESKRRVIDTIKMLNATKAKQNLPIFGVR